MRKNLAPARDAATFLRSPTNLADGISTQHHLDTLLLHCGKFSLGQCIEIHGGMLHRTGTISEEVETFEHFRLIAEATDELALGFQYTVGLRLACNVDLVVLHDGVKQGDIQPTLRILGVRYFSTKDAIILGADGTPFDHIGWLSMSGGTVPGEGFT